MHGERSIQHKTSQIAHQQGRSFLKAHLAALTTHKALHLRGRLGSAGGSKGAQRTAGDGKKVPVEKTWRQDSPTVTAERSC